MFECKDSSKISINTWTIVKTILILLCFMLAYVLRNIIGIIFVAVFFAAAIIPTVDWFQKHKIPRPVAVIIIYATLIMVFSIVIAFLVPPVYDQFNDITQKFPEYYDQVVNSVVKIQGTSGSAENVKHSINAWVKSFSGVAGTGVITILSSFFGGLVFLIIVLVIVFYMAVQENAIEKIVKSTLAEKYHDDIICLMHRIQHKLGYWLRSVMFLGFIIFCLTFLVLLPVMPKYALVLALFAGTMEIIPYIGPFLGAIPAVFLSFSFDSLFVVLYTLIAYVLIQQSENHLIVPQVMKRSVGLNPIVSVVMIMVGATLGVKFLDVGPIGAVVGVFLAIPLSVVIFEIINYIQEKKKGKPIC